MANKIMIDAGHGGYDNGASYNNRREKDDNLRLALAVGEILANSGIDVEYTRTTDVYQNPNEKAKIANDSQADYFISFHRNSSPTPNTYDGVETLIYNEGDVKEELANNINKQLESVGYDNLGIDVRKNLAVLRRTKMPAVLVETGFINSDKDNALFDQKFQDTANAIAQGVLETLNLKTTQVPPYYYRIQVGLFRNYNNAVNLYNQLISEGYDATIVRMGDYYAVLLGEYFSIEQAQQIENELNEKGYETLIIAL